MAENKVLEMKKVPLWRSLQTKYALTYLAVIAAVLLLMNTYPVIVSQDMVFKSKQTSLQSQATVIASALAGPDGLNQEGVSRVMEVLGDTGLSRVLVTDASCVVLYDTAQVSGALGRYALIPELTAALSPGTPAHTTPPPPARGPPRPRTTVHTPAPVDHP